MTFQSFSAFFCVGAAAKAMSSLRILANGNCGVVFSSVAVNNRSSNRDQGLLVVHYNPNGKNKILDRELNLSPLANIRTDSIAMTI